MKKEIHSTSLAAKVAAFNRANTEANRLAPLYRAAMQQFIGLRVTTASGEYLAKVSKVFPVASDGVQVFSPHKGCFVVKTCERYAEHSCIYAEAYFYAFSIGPDGTANEPQSEFSPLRTDYTSEEITRLRAIAEQAREAARQAENACAPFGEYDF